ncbi:hypothetical protein NQ314_000641 [Rhamnusium bicolor]|uniref:EF-hand domain-containing protein n=1 Tax=Rhamnusium bicolor TaxID=1586634 RepID=A0AAV8ZVB4_9CUCU|nr:hypothetical protein NQ314_000641 [Rhamnusium bicolor]
MDLSKLTSDEAYAFIDEIPSDTGSVISGAPSQDDIEEVDEDHFVEEVDEAHFVEVRHIHNINLVEYDSEDELPLSHFVKKPIEWTKDANFANTPLASTEDFGPNVPDDTEIPTDTFMCLFTTELIDKIVFETNLYAVQKFDDRFQPTDSEEIRCFLGVNLMMGLARKPSYRDHWSSTMQIRDPFISSSMSHDRFGWLLRHKNEPKHIVNVKTKLERGTCDWVISKNGLLYVKWMDNKPVLFLSNFHSPADAEIVRRKQKDGSSKSISCLKLVKDYNVHMGYVDQSDIDRLPNRKSLNLKDFRLDVCIELVGADPCMPKKGRKSAENVRNKFKLTVPAEIRFDKCAHLPVHNTIVSVEEWASMWDDYSKNPDNALEWQTQYLRFMFDLEDASGDGSIDVDEFTSVCSCYGLEASECKEAFQKIAQTMLSLTY